MSLFDAPFNSSSAHPNPPRALVGHFSTLPLPGVGRLPSPGRAVASFQFSLILFRKIPVLFEAFTGISGSGYAR